MDQTEVGLKAVVKALTDTIAGAIDPADHLAKEQLRLAASYVDFVRQRLHLIHARERYDLTRAIALARDLDALGPPDGAATQSLRARLAEAAPLADDAAALTGEVRLAAMELAHAVAGLVQEAHRARWPIAGAIDRAVLTASEARFEMERLWYQPIGFDQSPPKGARLEDHLR